MGFYEMLYEPCFRSSYRLKKYYHFLFSCQMRWSTEHYTLLCREVLMIKPYQYKPGTKESGGAWSLVSDELNTVQEVFFFPTKSL